MAEESVQKWLGRNRPPRVQITYDLETRGAIEKKELPLVVGILADLAGKQDPNKAETVADLKNRKFINIDRDNFEDVMKKIAPKLDVNVKGKQTITFETIDDFTPDRLVEKVDALKKVLIIRQRLNDVVARVDGATNPAAVLAEEKTKVAAEILALNPAPPTLAEKTVAATAAMLPQAETAVTSVAAASKTPGDAMVQEVAKLLDLANKAKAAADEAAKDPALAAPTAGPAKTAADKAAASAADAVQKATDAQTAAQALLKATDETRADLATKAASSIGDAKTAAKQAADDAEAAAKAFAALKGDKS